MTFREKALEILIRKESYKLISEMIRHASDRLDSLNRDVKLYSRGENVEPIEEYEEVSRCYAELRQNSENVMNLDYDEISKIIGF